MREYRFAVATASLTFLLLVVGGLVHATGSSLACPDWPLCHGQFFPAMAGGILFEHGHRLVAGAVAVLAVALAVLVWRRRPDPTLRALSVLAVGLVLVQAALGAATVLLKLPLLVSASHLATSMVFFATVIYLAHRLRPAAGRAAPAGPRRLVGIAALTTYAQIVLGGFVRHTGAGLACNVGIPLCEGALWPGSGPAQLHMAHRLLGAALAILVCWAALGPLRSAIRSGSRGRALLALAAPLLVLAQVALGFLTVTTFIAIPVVTAHVAFAALLLADLLALYLSLGARAAATGARHGDAVGLSPAHG